MVSNAIRGYDEVLAVPPRLLPGEPRWESFIDAWRICRSASTPATGKGVSATFPSRA